MTKKLFEIDSYLKECYANVKIMKEKDGYTWVSFDQTIFYPEGGGQPSDSGFVDDVSVTDVQIDDGEIFHKLEVPIEKSRVKLTIDFKRRFDHMQQHTGQHLLSAVWLELYGIKTNSFHLGKEFCTIDLETNELDNEKISIIEQKISQYIFENRTVENFLLPVDEVEPNQLMKLKEKPLFVRFIEIEGIDRSLCCGTHLRMLGELGLLKIISWEKYKQNVRLSFICGYRAFDYFQNLHETILEVSKKLNTSPTEVKKRFPVFVESYQALKKSYQKLYEKEIYQEAEQLCINSAKNVIEMSWDDRPIQEMKDLAKIIIEKDQKVVLLNNRNENLWIMAASSSSLFNVSKAIQLLKEHYGGKGGGNPVFGQWVGNLEEEGWDKIKYQLLNG